MTITLNRYLTWREHIENVFVRESVTCVWLWRITYLIIKRPLNFVQLLKRKSTYSVPIACFPISNGSDKD